MTTWLRQSTAVDIKMGPFLDATGGQVTGLSITQPDIRLAKNGGNWAQKSAAQTLAHEEGAWYEASLSTVDTATLGILLVTIHKTGALPVWREFMVVPPEVYDSLILAADGEPGTGAMPVSGSFITKLNYLYKKLRNRGTQSATQQNLFNDDATTIGQKRTVSDAAGVADVGEWVSGP